MNYIEALQALVDGKKIREKNWDKGKYVYTEDNLIVTDCGDVIELVVDVLEDITKDNWEIYQTEEERLIADGKRFSVFRKCKGHSCQRCSAMNPCLYKNCEDCPVYAECNAVKGGEYFVDMLTSEDFKDDEWFSRNMLTINEMWDKLNKED